jgi:hypothetical protein
MAMKLHPAAALAACLIGLAAPASAQNSAAEPPVVAPPPPTKTETPPPTTTIPPPTTTSEPSPPAAPPPEPVIVVPQTQTVPMEPVTIDPDAAYPEGFADPADPFGNDMSLAYRREQGFDWGLLGLLGLLGLIPLFLGRRERHIVHVDRDEAPRRVVRREEE